MNRGSVFRLELWVAAAAAASIVAIAIAAASPGMSLAAIASALFAAAIIFAGASATANAAHSDDPSSAVLSETTRLTVWTLAWSAAALFAAYPVAGLKWQHGWQYAAGYALLAAGFAAYLNRLKTDGASGSEGAALQATRTAATLFALAIFVAAGWLIASGKLETARGDWLANDIFLASAAAIFTLNVMFLLRTRR